MKNKHSLSFKTLKLKSLKLKITGMHCSACAMNIDGTLEDTGGIMESNTSYARCECEIEFDPEKVSNDEIIKAIETLGYKVATQ